MLPKVSYLQVTLEYERICPKFSYDGFTRSQEKKPYYDTMKNFKAKINVKGGKYSAFGEMSEADGIRYRDWNYDKIKEMSIHNADSDTLTLGKFRPSKNIDGTDN